MNFPNESHYLDLIVSLGVGHFDKNGIGGKPDNTSPNEAEMMVDYIRIENLIYNQSNIDIEVKRKK